MLFCVYHNHLFTPDFYTVLWPVVGMNKNSDRYDDYWPLTDAWQVKDLIMYYKVNLKCKYSTIIQHLHLNNANLRRLKLPLVIRIYVMTTDFAVDDSKSVL